MFSAALLDSMDIMLAWDGSCAVLRLRKNGDLEFVLCIDDFFFFKRGSE